ncbi:MAG TPA: GNAT family N-acetyltransferase [Jatrophihabitans sp.]|nr:GNAT family N-acetyltransferase [Jatrophihabitans sp.]
MTAIQAQPRVLDAADASSLNRLIEADPVTNCVLAARVEAAPDLDPRRLGGFVWGVDGPDGGLRAAMFHGGNLIPLGADLGALAQLAGQLGRHNRGCSSIVGPADAVEAIWPMLAPRWGAPRAIRTSQPLLVTRRAPGVPTDPQVRPVRHRELDRFLPAAIAMFTEELGISPVGSDGGRSYRNRVAELIAAGRAFARFDRDGRVLFKAEIGALSRHTAQIQGVWVHPALRGRGLGTAGLATVLNAALGLAPSASLYVNAYNVPARAMYDRLGFVQLTTLRTILF